MRVVFAGTPEFARQALASVMSAGQDVVLVLTQPDRSAGRGLHLTPSAVKAYALNLGLPVYQPVSLQDPAAASRVAEARPDVVVVAAYGLLLPPWALEVAPLGALNVHASLLPRWRGAAPIQRALLAGDAETGITIMRMDAGLDTGPMLARRAIPIRDVDTAGSLHDRLAALGASLIVEVLREASSGRCHVSPQPAEGITYAHKIRKKDALLDWREPADVLGRAVRAFNPAPGAATKFGTSDFKIWQAYSRQDSVRAEPGRVLAWAPDGLVVACGKGVLVVTELQRAGGKRLPVGEFIRGYSLEPGARFELPPV